MAVVLLVVGVLPGSVRPLHAETMGTLAHDERIVVRGLTQIDPGELSRALAANDELLLLSRPLASRKAFLAAVAAKATLALQHAGFAEVAVKAGVESSGDGERVVIDVVEGPRHDAAGIEIVGLPGDLAEGLHRWLQSQRPPPGAVPQSQDVGGAWSGVRWIDGRGQPAPMDPPVWSPGQPAPFDPHHLPAVRAAIGRFFRDEGYFAAAKLVEAAMPSPRSHLVTADAPAVDAPACHVSLRCGADGTTLAIEFVHLPPASVLHGIEVLPGSRTTAADLQAFLGIVPGGRVTERERLAWREQLRQSGRFVRHEVRLRDVADAAGGAASPGVVAVFDLDDYPRATPLGEPLSREEQVMLACRTWLLATLADENDLSVTWRSVPGAGAGDHQPHASGEALGVCVISTTQGALVKALPGSADACGMAVSRDGLGWFLPRDAGWLAVPLPKRYRACVDVAISLSETIEEGRHHYRRAIATSFGLEPRPREAEAALAVTARIEPVACLAVVHEGDPALSWEDGELVVARADLTARFDARSGRLISVRLPAGGCIDVTSEAGAFASDLESLRAAAGPDRGRAEALVSSAIDFFTDEAMGDAARRLCGVVGKTPRMEASLEALAAIGTKLRRVAQAEGFAAADRVVSATLADRIADSSATKLVIPTRDRSPAATDPVAAVARQLATRAWRWTEQACGRETWPAALARVVAFASTRDATAVWELTAYMGSKRYGPIAQLAASWLAPMRSLSEGLARQGQSRLTVEAFLADCQPLLSFLRHSGLDEGTVMLLRAVEDDEARRLGAALVQDPEIVLPLVRDLRDRESDAAAIATLTESLGRWWQESLRTTVARALAARIQLQTADNPDAGEKTPVR